MELERISAVVVSHNSERTIARCLDSLSDFGERIVVDAFSTDRTLDIARSRAVTVYSRAGVPASDPFEWAMRRARHPWVLLLHAHDEVSVALLAAIRSLVPGADTGFRVDRRLQYLGRPLRRCGGGRAVHLVRRTGGQVPRSSPLLGGTVIDRRFGTIEDHIAAIQEQSDADCARAPRGRRAILPMLLHPPAAFIRGYLVSGGFVDGKNGFVFCLLSSYGVFLTYAKAWQAGERITTD